MLRRLIEWSVGHKLLVLLGTGAVTVAGLWALFRTPVDAIPDLSDTQVIVYSKWDHSPDLVEAQVTYPIVSAMLGGSAAANCTNVSLGTISAATCGNGCCANTFSKKRSTTSRVYLQASPCL